MLGRAPKRIDILTQIDGVAFRGAWARRVHARLDQRRRVPIIGREDLLAAKLAAGGPQDLADAAAIQEFIAEEKMRRRSDFDAGTGLPNRAALRLGRHSAGSEDATAHIR
jgi:hypothetical protein